MSQTLQIYLCKGWDKKCGRRRSFVKSSCFGGNSMMMRRRRRITMMMVIDDDDDDGQNPTCPPLTSAGLKPSHHAKMCLCCDHDFNADHG